MGMPNGITDVELAAAGYAATGDRARKGNLTLTRCWRCRLWWKQVMKLGREEHSICDHCRRRFKYELEP